MQHLSVCVHTQQQIWEKSNTEEELWPNHISPEIQPESQSDFNFCNSLYENIMNAI